MAERRPTTIIATAKLFWQEVNDDDLTGMAGEAAYNLLLALFPALIFVAALAGFVGAAAGVDGLFDQVMAMLAQVMPASALDALAGPLGEVLSTQSAGLLSLGIAGTLWAASNAIAALMKGCNRAYGVRETRPFWLHRLLIAVGLTLVMTLLLLIAFVALALGEQLVAGGARLLGLDPGLATIWRYVRWPLSILSILVALALLYWLGPNVRHRFRLFSPGALAATALWLLFTLLFQVFVVGFANYSATYGTIAGIIVLLLWLNYSSLIFLLGAELNQALDQARRHPAAPDAAAGSPPAATTAIAPAARPPAWLAPATLALWTLIILVGAFRRGQRA